MSCGRALVEVGCAAGQWANSRFAERPRDSIASRYRDHGLGHLGHALESEKEGEKEVQSPFAR